MTKFEYIMNRLAPRYGVHVLFSDFMDLLIAAFSNEQKEEQYMEIVNKYEKPEAYKLSEALTALVIEMTGNDGNGIVDVLGKYFQENVSHGENGQYFTPQHICDMMARMHNPVNPIDRILDPACGSGRMLLAAAKVNRFAKFYGADIDTNCAKMAVLNLCLNGMYGEVAWMNTLTNQYFGGWQIVRTIKGIPRIQEISERESCIHFNRLEDEYKTFEITQQQLIFEF